MNYHRIVGFSIALIFISLILVTTFYLRLILAPFIIAYILQFPLRPFVNMLKQRGVKHTAAVSLVFISALVLIMIFLSILIPAISSELSNIHDNIEDYSAILIKKYNEIQEILLDPAGPFKSLMRNESLIHEFTSYLKSSLLFFIQNIPQKIFTFLPLVLYIVVIPFATFFFLLDAQRIKERIIRLIPNRYFEISLNILHSLHKQFSLILRGMFMSAIIISILASAGLWIIGLEYPILVGIFAGMANLIPYFGPIVGIVAASLVAVVTGSPPIFFLSIVLTFVLVNLLDNVLVQPMILARAANLHPLIVIFLVLTGSKIGGILGMLLAVPVASLLQVVIIILFKELKRPARPDFSQYVDI